MRARAVLLSLRNADAVMLWHATAATSAEMLFQHWWHRGTGSVSNFLHVVKALGSHISEGMDLPMYLSGASGKDYEKEVARQEF